MRRDIDNAQIAAEYAAGDSTRAIGERYGISHVTVAERLRETGVKLRARWREVRLRVCKNCECSFFPRRPEQVICRRDCRREPHRATCKHGHRLTPDNLTPRYGRTGPRCRTCLYKAQARYRAKQKGN